MSSLMCAHRTGSCESQCRVCPDPIYNIQEELIWGLNYRKFKESERANAPLLTKKSPLNIPFKICRQELRETKKRKRGVSRECESIRSESAKDKLTLLDRNVMSQSKYMRYLSTPNPKFDKDDEPRHKKPKRRCELEPCPPRFVQLAVPNKRRVFANWKDYQHFLPVEMLLRFEEILHTDLNLEPRQARNYYKLLDKRKRKERNRKRMLKKKKRQAKDRGDRVWLMQEIEELTKEMVDYIKEEPLFALNYKQLMLSDGILERLEKTDVVKTKIKRKTRNHYKKTVVEISDKCAVWIDTLTRFVDVQAVESEEDIPPLSISSLSEEEEGEEFESSVEEEEEEEAGSEEEGFWEEGSEMFGEEGLGEIADGIEEDILDGIFGIKPSEGEGEFGDEFDGEGDEGQFGEDGELEYDQGEEGGGEGQGDEGEGELGGEEGEGELAGEEGEGEDGAGGKWEGVGDDVVKVTGEDDLGQGIGGLEGEEGEIDESGLGGDKTVDDITEGKFEGEEGEVEEEELGIEGEEFGEEGELGEEIPEPPVEIIYEIPGEEEGEGKIIRGHKPSVVMEHSPDGVCCLSLKIWAVWLLEVTHNAHNWTRWISNVIRQIKEFASTVRGDVKLPNGQTKPLRKADWRKFCKETEESIIAWRQYSAHVKDLSDSIIENFHGKKVFCCPKCLQDHLIKNVVTAHDTLQALTEAMNCAGYWQRILDALVEKTGQLTTGGEEDEGELSDGSRESVCSADLEEIPDEKKSSSGESIYEIEEFENNNK